jgi:hypothetical protein
MKKIGIDFDLATNDFALNIHFEESGFESKQFLKNSGSSFFFLIIYIIMWIILLLISILSTCKNYFVTLK